MLTLTDEQYERICTRAEARVVWGDPPEEVIGSMVQSGLEQAEAEALVGEWMKVRNNEVRVRGVRKIVIGSAMLAGAILFFTAMPWGEWVRSVNEMTGGRTRRGIGGFIPMAAAAAGLVGFWWIIRGITALLVPQGQELTDVE